MEGIERLLRDHAFFADVDEQTLQTIAGCAANLAFKEDEFLFRQGEPADRFYIVRAGKVAVEIHDPSRGALGIQTVCAGEVLGWSWLFEPYRWRFDARALDTVRVTSLDGRCLREKCERDPRLGYLLMGRISRMIVERLMGVRLQLLDLYGSRQPL